MGSTGTLWLATPPVFTTSGTTTVANTVWYQSPTGWSARPEPLGQAYDYVEWQVLQLQRELIEDLCRRF